MGEELIKPGQLIVDASLQFCSWAIFALPCSSTPECQVSTSPFVKQPSSITSLSIWANSHPLNNTTSRFASNILSSSKLTTISPAQLEELCTLLDEDAEEWYYMAMQEIDENWKEVGVKGRVRKWRQMEQRNRIRGVFPGWLFT